MIHVVDGDQRTQSCYSIMTFRLLISVTHSLHTPGIELTKHVCGEDDEYDDVMFNTFILMFAIYS